MFFTVTAWHNSVSREGFLSLKENLNSCNLPLPHTMPEAEVYDNFGYLESYFPLLSFHEQT